MIFSFQTRIVLFFSLLFVGVQAATLVTVYSLSRHNVISQVEQNLSYAGRVFNRLLTSRGERMAAEVSILSADYGFRSTVNNGDVDTLRSALQNLMLRIHAQRVFYIDSTSKIIADSGQSLEQQAFPFPIALSLAESSGRSVCFALIDGLPHILAAVPVLAPIPIGWVAVAIRVDNSFVEHFKNLSPAAMQITLAEQTPTHWRVLASTLSEPQQQQLSALDQQVTGNAEQPSLLAFADSQWINLRFPLPSGDHEQKIFAFLQVELDSVLSTYQPFWWSAGGLFGLGLFATLLGGLFLARQVSKPVRQLSQAVRRVDAGDFSQPVKLYRKDELGRLAQAFNGMMQGIAERETRIAYQLRHDSLTHLPNRLFFEENLTTALMFSDQYAVLLVGLNRYAEINSTLGHELGDLLVRNVSAALQAHMPQEATWAHLSGDEFALIMPSGCGQADLQQLAQQVLGTFNQPFSLGVAAVDVSVNIGIVHAAKDGFDAQTLLRKADAALFVARQSQHVFHIYDEASDPCQPEALSLMGELRAGLDAGQFSLYVQPQLDIKRKQITHVECLIRWRHPERGFMPPDRFIPLAEQTGNISKLTAWVVQEAFRLRQQWQQQGLAVKLAINLSAHDLQDQHLPVLLDQLLANDPLAADGFVLEITESAVMQDAQQALNVLKMLNARGFLLSIDDFGTGYSSMAYLQKLPLHELKIDKAFVLSLATSAEDAVIVHSIIELAHNLGLKVVAEGLENAESFAVLERLGCDLAQGYWLSRPIPADDFAEWLKKSPWWAH
ncbi:EAL domain-containing protein [Methylosoma difficile]